MKEIYLDELQESKEFKRNIRIANDLTKKTGIEHGFKFCKPNDEIVIDKICSGLKCSMIIEPEKCNIYDSSFHVHPNIATHEQPIITKKAGMLSVGDIFNSAYNSFVSNKPNITCVKDTSHTITYCEKIHIKDKETMSHVKLINDLFYINPTHEKQTKAIDLLHKITKSKFGSV